MSGGIYGGIGLNPVTDRRDCWRPCQSCWKCSDQGRYSKCATCPARVDVPRRLYPDLDSFCQCREGILRHRVIRTGQLVLRKFLSDPFQGHVQTDAISEDEEEWNRYIQERREFLNNPTWDPIKFMDGTGTSDWADQYRVGRGW